MSSFARHGGAKHTTEDTESHRGTHKAGLRVGLRGGQQLVFVPISAEAQHGSDVAYAVE
jgi:hypothetical protein